MTKWDPTLLRLSRRHGVQFPDRRQMPDGYPRTGAEVVAHLELLRRRGVTHLVFLREHALVARPLPGSRRAPAPASPTPARRPRLRRLAARHERRTHRRLRRGRPETRGSRVTPGSFSSTCSASDGSATTCCSSTGWPPRSRPSSSTCEARSAGSASPGPSPTTTACTRVSLARETLAWVRSADLLLNVMGFCTDEELLAAARHRVFLDTDPGFGQMWHELGLADVFTGHDAYVTIGAADRLCRTAASRPAGCAGRRRFSRSCSTSGRVAPPPPAPFAFGAIATWRGAYAPVEYRGRRYGLRAHEFRRFAELPRRHRPPLRARARHRSGGRRRSQASRRRRFQPRRPLRRHGDARRLPPLRATRLGGVDGGEGDVRGQPQRLVQRAQRLLPRLGQAGSRPGHRSRRRFRPARAWSRSRISTMRRPASRRSPETGNGTRARPATSQRSTSIPTSCSAACSSGWEPTAIGCRVTTVVLAAAIANRHAPRRQHLGAPELGGRAAATRLRGLPARRALTRRHPRRVRGRDGRAGRQAGALLEGDKVHGCERAELLDRLDASRAARQPRRPPAESRPPAAAAGARVRRPRPRLHPDLARPGPRRRARRSRPLLHRRRERRHSRSSTLPGGDVGWRPIRQPVVLEDWPVSEGDFTVLQHGRELARSVRPGGVAGPLVRSQGASVPALRDAAGHGRPAVRGGSRNRRSGRARPRAARVRRLAAPRPRRGRDHGRVRPLRVDVRAPSSPRPRTSTSRQRAAGSATAPSATSPAAGPPSCRTPASSERCRSERDCSPSGPLPKRRTARATSWPGTRRTARQRARSQRSSSRPRPPWRRSSTRPGSRREDRRRRDGLRRSRPGRRQLGRPPVRARAAPTRPRRRADRAGPLARALGPSTSASWHARSRSTRSFSSEIPATGSSSRADGPTAPTCSSTSPACSGAGRPPTSPSTSTSTPASRRPGTRRGSTWASTGTTAS